MIRAIRVWLPSPEGTWSMVRMQLAYTNFRAVISLK